MNEFVARTGLISKQNAYVTGSVTATQGFTGSLEGTASWARNAIMAVSASWASTSFVATSASFASTSFIATSATSASWASASFVAISASFASSSDVSVSSSFASQSLTASSLSGLPLVNTSSILVQTASNVIVNQLNTGSYISAFFDYALTSGSQNLRAGTVFGGWINNTASWTEYSVVDLGDTSQVTMSMLVTASMVQLLANASSTLSWSVRSIGRFL